MSTHKASSKFRGSEALSVLWSRRVQIGRAVIGQWIPRVVAVALALTLVSAATALAAGSEPPAAPAAMALSTTLTLVVRKSASSVTTPKYKTVSISSQARTKYTNA